MTTKNSNFQFFPGLIFSLPFINQNGLLEKQIVVIFTVLTSPICFVVFCVQKIDLGVKFTTFVKNKIRNAIFQVFYR